MSPSPSKPIPQPKPRFQTTRPAPSALLIPQKRPLFPPKQNPPINPNTTIRPPSLLLAASSNPDPTPEPREQASGIRPRDTEFNFAAAPQPFLDPGCWERIRGVDAARAGVEGQRGGEGLGGHAGMGLGVEESEELQRRRRVREAEFGGLAVRGRLR
ncbi:hypothetical protein BO82DRAFT_390536 [Aspergillus uvarum CBS 121591]|uniref:Uncharacterized protein n=1 Tax=Aspergillus uvarum CBS 121591 TaxID=1448315 RepID=A0A319CLW9_9EURO|nr:hypothetical protein BO82DRAFT_390536 [Aspergillus uvarum CBS 121591]PYH84097.1 hypothetical protein BO82DRAFT_390536 [Aspergillus uvarum CBS 121591]